jgi:hypothetical protein
MMSTQEQLKKLNNIKEDIRFLKENVTNEDVKERLDNSNYNLSQARDYINGLTPKDKSIKNSK